MDVRTFCYMVPVCDTSFLLEIVFKVARDAVVQMHALVSAHVVRLARIEKEVGLCAGCDTSLEERQTML